MHAAVSALGRLLFGGYFIYNGVNHFQNRAGMAQYAGAKGVPAPDAVVLSTGALLLLGGTSVLSGYKPRTGLGLLGLFLVGVTPGMHRFWDLDDPQARMGEQVNFLKNVALLGSVLMLMASRSPTRSPRSRRLPVYDSGLPTD